MTAPFLILTDEEVDKLIQPRAFYAAVEDALLELAKGRAISPKEVVIEGPEESLHYAYAGWLPNQKAVGVKVLHAIPENPSRGLPYVQAIVVLSDDRTGEVRAVVEARVLTAYRTASACALASRYLAPPEPRTLAILGAGPQARAHGRIMPLEHAYRSTRIWARHREHADRLADELGSLGHDASAVSSITDALDDADVIVTATRSRQPLFTRTGVRDGALICVVGPLRPWGCEVDLDLIHHSVLVTDDRSKFEGLWEGYPGAPTVHPQSLLDLLMSPAAYQPDDRLVRVFKGVGVAIEDVAAAQWVWIAAHERLS